MKIAVTGSKGFLGSRIMKTFIQDGNEVTGIQLPQTDISDYINVKEKLFSIRPELIIHCAAISDIGKCEQDHSLAYRVNISGTRNIASVCADLGAAMIFASSDQIYDYYEMQDITEYTPLKAHNFYGFTKIEGEKIVRDLVNKHFIARLAWQYGFEEDGLPYKGGLLGYALNACSSGEKLEFTAGCARNINYVYDTVDVIMSMSKRHLPYGIYNVASNNDMSYEDTLRFILKSLGAPEDKISCMLIENKAAKKFDLRARPYNLELASYSMPDFKQGLFRYLKESVRNIKMPEYK